MTVSYEGFKALDGVSVAVESGSIEVLVGPNGAGKSTLLDTIIGRVRPTSGRVCFKDADLVHLAEHEIVRRGICRKFQAPGVLEALTIEDNLALAARRDRRAWSSFGTRSSVVERNRIEAVLDIVGLAAKRRELAGSLAHGEKQWLEIGMVVASDAELLLLDEPAAGMTHAEAEATAALIRRLSGKHAFIVIDHDMDFVEQLAAPVSVLHMGRMLMRGSVEDVRRDPQVAAVYLGRPQEAARAAS